MRDPQISLSDDITNFDPAKPFTLEWRVFGESLIERFATLPEVLNQLGAICAIPGESGISHGSPRRLIWSDGRTGAIVRGGLLWEYGRACAEGWMDEAQLAHIEIMEWLGLETETPD